MFSVNDLSIEVAQARAEEFIREAERDRQTEGLAPARGRRTPGDGRLSRWMRQFAFGLPATGSRSAASAGAD